MKKTIIAFTLVATLTIAMFASVSPANAATTLTTCAELQNIDLTTDYILEADINCDVAPYNTGAGFTPIGSHFGLRYTGTFDGQGHSITGLFIDTTQSYVGLFEDVDGTVSNLNITSASITSTAGNVGILAGNNRGTVTNVDVSGTVNGLSTVGGLAGTNNGPITFSSSSATVISRGGSSGGFVGFIDEGTIDSSFATGDVTDDGGSSIGGFVGTSGSAVTNSYATGDVTSLSNSDSVGGFAGVANAPITNSYATGDVGGGTRIGGFVGAINNSIQLTRVYATGNVTASLYSSGGLIGSIEDGTVSESYATGDVNGIDGGAGGFVGQMITGLVEKSFSTGNVTSTNYYIGGFIGLLFGGTINNSYARGNATSTLDEVGGFAGESSGTITKSYSTGISTGGIDIGGFLGYLNNNNTQDSFWDSQTSGLNLSAGAETAKTTSQMKAVVTFTDTVGSVGLDNAWDFSGTPNNDVATDDIWTIDSENDGYPRFAWFVAPEAPNDNILTGGFISSLTGKTVDLNVTGDCENGKINEQAESSHSVQDIGFDYPDGFVRFELSSCAVGTTVRIEISFFNVSDPSLILRKYIARTGAYFTVESATYNRTVVDGVPVTTVVYFVTDGGALDDDGIANGTIIDPVGLGKVVVGAPRTGAGGTAD